MSDAMPILDWTHGDPAELRAIYRSERLKLVSEVPQDVRIATKMTSWGNALVFTPPEAGNRIPILYFHGGSWMVGGPDTHQSLCGWLSKLSGRVVTSVPYRLAPEHPYPAQREDARAALAALLETHERVFVCGDSAGGALALWAQATAPAGRVAGAITLYGAFGVTSSASLTRFGEGSDGLTQSAVEAIYRRLALADPSGIRSDMLGGDAPLLLLRAELDPLGDDNGVLAAELGCRDLTQVTAAGFGHGFLQMSGRDPAARAEMARIADWMAARDPN